MNNLEDLLCKHIKKESREKIGRIIDEIKSLGYEFVHKTEDGFPMLMGGLEFYARKGTLLMVYDIRGCLTLQCNKKDFINWEGDFVCKHYPATYLTLAYRQIT